MSYYWLIPVCLVIAAASGVVAVTLVRWGLESEAEAARPSPILDDYDQLQRESEWRTR